MTKLATVHSANARQALASCGPVFVSVLRQPIDLADVAALRAEAMRMASKHGGKAVSLAVIEPTAASPAAPEVRDALAAFAREGFVNAAAIVIEGTGFRAAATRTVVAGMYLVTKKSYPHKIVATTGEGAAWLVGELAAAGVAAPTAADIVAAAEKARAAIG